MRSFLAPLLAFCATYVVATGGCVCARKQEAPPRAEPTAAAGASVMKLEGKSHCPDALLAAREGGTDPDRYVVPSEAQRNAMRALIGRLTETRTAEKPDVAREAKEAGFELLDVGSTNLVLVREAVSARKGGGAYLVRLGAPSKLVVQAPHTFFDEGTLPLACELFERAQAAALFIETAHRYKAAPQTKDGEHPADVAHARTSLFHAATEGALHGRPKATVVQLHGFAPRESGGSVVLSNGEKTPDQPLVVKVARALRSVIDGGVLEFPKDQTELGATTNVQGAIVREAGGQFLHVEIEARLRRDLLSNPQLRASVLSALANALEGA